MTKKMTQAGARNVTAMLDDIAELFEFHHESLGTPKKIAMDFAHRCDLLSEHLEKVAGEGKDEEGESVDHGESGTDANMIADQVPGPIESQPDEASYTGDNFTQQEHHELAEKQEAGALPAVEKAAANTFLKTVAEQLLKLAEEGEEEVEVEEGEEEVEASKKASVTTRINLFE